jgi:ABC-type transport system involved in cytochrome bd biosynthesis fused ATPase/permease subunit
MLCLSRGLYMAKKNDSNLILLDEPTSSIDAKKEISIYKNIFEYFATKCIIVSMHKLHLLRMFDFVYVMQNGQIIQNGTFNDLVACSNGYFKTLWEKYLLSTNRQFIF